MQEKKCVGAKMGPPAPKPVFPISLFLFGWCSGCTYVGCKGIEACQCWQVANHTVHESFTADTRDHEDHTFCGMMCLPQEISIVKYLRALPVVQTPHLQTMLKNAGHC